MSRYLRYAMATSNLQQTLLVPLFSANGTLFIFLDRGSFIRRQWTTVASRALEHVATCDNLPGICLPVSNSPSWLRSDQWGKGSSLGDSWKYSPAHIREMLPCQDQYNHKIISPRKKANVLRTVQWKDVLSLTTLLTCGIISGAENLLTSQVIS